ncbi:MAG: DNA gyrase inhibitor YacG [Shimia sp.]|uniref:DNA gyrase inhibitor YacG n=1 Tax=unclassified Shimia TaxID=2630038 RepID=UPI001B14AD96|nr:DNA gyrase inhibitor YacG [Shimia sp.]MBO6896746.1 DNA gyrase inhibitor YacG [Shimia sp.]MCP4205712.1 DNA gyrase inhibitor YacG [Shimia sp.]MCP4825607.1 DNA gyrase inhibitor YacG [Shimia sp.]
MSCPICKKDTVQTYRPFCSKRCADIDLGKWFGGDYAVPSQDPEEAIEALEEMEKQTSRLH